MKILQKEAQSIDLIHTNFKNQCREGKWYKFNRIFILKSSNSNTYTVVNLNSFERIFKAIIGNRNFFRLLKDRSLKGVTIVRICSIEKIGNVLKDIFPKPNTQSEKQFHPPASEIKPNLSTMGLDEDQEYLLKSNTQLEKQPDLSIKELLVDNGIEANDVIPPELWTLVFENLGAKELGNTIQVSKTFLEIASKQLSKVEKEMIEGMKEEMALIFNTFRPFITLDIDGDVQMEFFIRNYPKNNRTFQIYFDYSGKFLGFGKENFRIYTRDLDTNIFKKVFSSRGGPKPRNLPFETGKFFEIWLNFDKDSVQINAHMQDKNEQEKLKRFPIHKILEKALIHFGSEFLVGVQEIAKKRNISFEDVLKDFSISSEEIWKASASTPPKSD